nr:hypothetical protein [Tanacetum cinerariifolium]
MTNLSIYGPSGGTDGGSDGESGLDLLRDEDGNSDESSRYQVDDGLVGRDRVCGGCTFNVKIVWVWSDSAVSLRSSSDKSSPESSGYPYKAGVRSGNSAEGLTGYGGTDGGSDGESGLDLLRDEDGNSDKSSRYQVDDGRDRVGGGCTFNVKIVWVWSDSAVSLRSSSDKSSPESSGYPYKAGVRSGNSAEGLTGYGGTDGGSDGESGLDLLRDEDGNSDESSRYQVDDGAALHRFMTL